MPEAIKAFPDITLVIAGEGPIEDNLKRESINLGINKNMLFAGPKLDMPLLLKLFDIYVLPSLWEGLPMVFLDAMAAGCPVITTNVGGISAIIKHDENGSLIMPKKPKLLTSEISDLLYDRKLRNHYSQNGLKQFRKKFSADVMTRKYERLYLRNMGIRLKSVTTYI